MTERETPRLLSPVFAIDERGTFFKPFPPREQDLAPFEIAELFWTTSARGVIRGMHFQFEPDAIGKLVWVSQGAIFDVLVDLREGPSFGAVTTWDLNAATGACLYAPRGFAHGFQSLEDATIVNYAQDAGYSPENDAGIRWDSIEVEWPLPPTVISERDRVHPALIDFEYRFSGNPL